MMLGPVNWAGRLTTAWVGLIGVACVIRAGNALFPQHRAGLFAGLVLAAFYWDINFSRFGIPPILTAMATAGTMGAVWQGVRTGQRASYALAGMCLAIGLYSYVPFRLFVVVPLVTGLALLITQPALQRRSILTGGLVMADVAFILYIPLLTFFIQNPAWFLNRFGQTTQDTLGAASRYQTLLENARLTLDGLFFSGDQNWRHNLSTRPALDSVQSLFFLLGIAASLRRWRSAETWTLITWLLVGLTPSVITVEAPHFGRTTMVTPAVALTMAWGIQTAWDTVSRRWVRGLIGVALGLSFLLTVRDYFVRWANDPNVLPAFNTQQVWLADTLRTAPSGAALYVTPMDYRDDFWTFEYVLGSETFKRFRVFNGRKCLVLPSATMAGAMYAVIVHEDPSTLASLAQRFPTGTIARPSAPADHEYLNTYLIPDGPATLGGASAAHANFGDMVALADYALSKETIAPGSSVTLSVAWAIKQPTPLPYKVFVHFVGAPQADGNTIYAQYDGPPCASSYPTWQWQPGETWRDAYSLTLPNALPPGEYRLHIGWYHETSGTRLPLHDALGQPVGDAFQIVSVSLP